MKTLIIIAVLAGICVAVISGLWVAVALIKAVGAGRRPDMPENETQRKKDHKGEK